MNKNTSILLGSVIIGLSILFSAYMITSSINKQIESNRYTYFFREANERFIKFDTKTNYVYFELRADLKDEDKGMVNHWSNGYEIKDMEEVEDLIKERKGW